MNSTSTSKGPILEIKDLNVTYNLDTYIGQRNSLRDSFVSLVSSPLRYITRSKNVLHVLDNINIKINQGDRVGLIGVNGAGKTTLCRAISGMLNTKRGEISLQGKVRPIFNTSIGILPELTGRENAELLAKLLYPELSEDDLQKLLSEALGFSELGDFIHVPYMNYSKGMQARLYLSLISARPCDLLILDEVFDGADEYFQKKMNKRILDIIHRSGAVLFVSHNPEQVRQSCNRVLVLHKNKIAYDGPVEKGLAFYRTFLG